MKDLLKLTVVAAFGIIALASCKKDYACDCTVSGASLVSGTMNDVKKKSADNTCSSLQTNYKLVDPNATCKTIVK